MKKNLKYHLRVCLSAEELKLVPSSFDVVGDIMIFHDFPPELERKEKLIGKVILGAYRQVKTVLKKTKKYSGSFRTPRLKIIAGERRKESTCRENNVLIRLDVEKVYFSTRMGTERKRISEMIKPGEKVMVMFSGCAPYPLVIARNSECGKVYGVEMNPVAHKYALENVKMNKLEDKISLHLGDVRKVLPKMRKRFDRILMPLPKGGEDFLDLAVKRVKKNGIVHFYDFLHEDEFSRVREKVENACIGAGRQCEVLRIVKCGQYAPGFYRVCADVLVN